MLFLSACGNNMTVPAASGMDTQPPVPVSAVPSQAPLPTEASTALATGTQPDRVAAEPTLALPPLAPSQMPSPSLTSTNTPLSTSAFFPTPVAQVVAFVNPRDQAQIVYVPEGEFVMGYNDAYNHDPEHSVYLDAFWIYKTEVTNAQFGRFVSNTNYRTDREHAGSSMIWSMHGGGPREGASWRQPFGPGTTIDGQALYPVVHVSWNDAVAYCQWAGARLPTEAEWEKAARSGDGRLFPWGDEAETRSCKDSVYYCNTTGMLAPVGSYPPGASPYGAWDMIGNAAEWVWDFFAQDYYAISPARNPAGPAGGDAHVFRGSEGAPSGQAANAVARNTGYPDEASQLLGFRCASSEPALASIAPRLTSTAQFAPTARPTPTPSSTPAPTRVIAVGRVEKVYVPAGEFTMGSYSGDLDEQPEHQVFVDGFYIDRVEVTNARYELCVRAGVCVPPRADSSATRPLYYGNPEFDDYPVIFVDWGTAGAYCEWQQGRLPTEAEWEKAARGADARRYPWGNAIEAGCGLLNFAACGAGDTRPVGNFPGNASVYGVLDMSGNVWEWVSSAYEGYPYDRMDGREALDSGANRVFRGGAWNSPAEHVTTSFRSWDAPSNMYNFLGFRCAASAP